MQSLYESDFYDGDTLDAIAERHLRAAGKSDDDSAYIQKTVAGLQATRADIEALIRTHAPEWPLEQIAGIDRAILRLGIYEILNSDEVPPKVAINEAVEIAKQYGGENSGSFVNGVLGTVYRASDKFTDQEKAQDDQAPDQTS